MYNIYIRNIFFALQSLDDFLIIYSIIVRRVSYSIKILLPKCNETSVYQGIHFFLGKSFIMFIYFYMMYI